jgi:hypothetical protein
LAILSFQIPPGIVRGASPDDFPGRYYDGNMVRWRNGVLEPVGGWQRLTSSPFDHKLRIIHPWRSNEGASHILVGTDVDVRSYNSGAWTDVSPPNLVPFNDPTALGGYGTGPYGEEAYGTGRTSATSIPIIRPLWTMSNWGEDVIACSSTDGRLLYFDVTNPGTTMKVVGVYDISAISRAANVVTVTTSEPHNLATSDTVEVSGVTDASFDTATAIVTVTGSDTFTYAQAGANTSSSGGTVRDKEIPVANRGVIVTAERHLVAIGVNGSPFEFGWSSREDYLDWDFASTTNTAGSLPVDTETPLHTLTNVREGVLLLTQDRAILSRYVGLPFIYNKEDLGATTIMSPMSLAQFSGRAVWMGQGGFWLYEGSVVKPLPCTLEDYVFSDINLVWAPHRAFAAHHAVFNEIWFFYPSADSEDGECDRLVIWCWDENWWSKGELPRTAMAPAGAYPYPLLSSHGKHLFQHDSEWTYEGFDETTIAAETSVINAPGDEDILSISQLMVGTAAANTNRMRYTIYTRLTSDGAERTFGPYTGRSDGYVDVRATGRDVRLRINSAVAGDWSVGRIRMKVGAAGGRR